MTKSIKILESLICERQHQAKYLFIDSYDKNTVLMIIAYLHIISCLWWDDRLFFCPWWLRVTLFLYGYRPVSKSISLCKLTTIAILQWFRPTTFLELEGGGMRTRCLIRSVLAQIVNWPSSTQGCHCARLNPRLHVTYRCHCPNS